MSRRRPRPDPPAQWRGMPIAPPSLSLSVCLSVRAPREIESGMREPPMPTAQQGSLASYDDEYRDER